MTTISQVICSACHAPHIPKPDRNGLCNKCYLFSLGAKLNEKAMAYFKASEAAKH
jgi:hypothetical protein